MSVQILVGSALELLRRLPAESVHCVVTSPPYWGLRDYGVEGQIGLEPTPEEYVAALVAVFREVHRVLRPDGTLWLNLGDSYIDASGAGKQGKTGQRPGRRYTKSSFGVKKRVTVAKLDGHTGTQDRALRADEAGRFAADLKPKDLVGIPWRVAFALQSDGWYLRSDIIWHKPNPMPESVEDRPTKAHEYLFLLSKAPRYFYDAAAIREPDAGRASVNGFTGRQGSAEYQARSGGDGTADEWEPGGGRNKRTVWTVASQPFKGAHFATFPPRLIEPCILAGCPIGGTVLDPFGGAGTTGMVADRLGRNAILIELNPNYAAIAEARIREDGPIFAEVNVGAA